MLFEGLEIGGGYVTGDVGSVKDGGIEVREAGADLGDGILKVAEILKDDAVGADGFGKLVDGLATGDEFGARGHIDAVDVGVDDGRRSGADVNASCSELAAHGDDLFNGGAANDGVVNEEDVLAGELLRDRGAVCR